MSFDTSVTVEHLDELVEHFDQVEVDLSGQPMVAGMRKATLLITQSARKGAPVDRGPLRASIVPDVVTGANVVHGIVGSNVKYAPFQELGTRPFTPPWAPIFAWALRKTQGSVRAAAALAAGAIRSISRRGIIAKRFLQNAVEENGNRIIQILSDAIRNIVGGD